MSTTVGDFLLRRLSEWEFRRIFGFPGDGITGIVAALDRAGDKFDFVQVRHEEMAAFMACAHAKFTGEVGVCLATSGPGAIHLLNGLYDARLDHQPVVAIVGQQGLSALGGNYQQEVDLVSLYKDVAGDYVHMASTPNQVRHLVDRAVRIALAERTVTCIYRMTCRRWTRSRNRRARTGPFTPASDIRRLWLSRRKRTCAVRQMR